jgi:AbrB family looped-hinge helix DNA binding protein
MTKKSKNKACREPSIKDVSCCRVESLISVDERGQMVLPKEIRDKAKIRPGDKLAVVSWEKEGRICCISLIKVEELTEIVKDRLGPVMKEILQK